jgi:predicted HTH transcriptional regulator
MNDQLLESLLREDEGTALDFKRDQYPFVGVNDDSLKSELLKDILAFANSWRRSGAFILIGVQEVTGGRSNAVGVSSHIPDASL